MARSMYKNNDAIKAKDKCYFCIDNKVSLSTTGLCFKENCPKFNVVEPPRMTKGEGSMGILQAMEVIEDKFGLRHAEFQSSGEALAWTVIKDYIKSTIKVKDNADNG